eukprot:3384457-Pyramimonas_sp.AAC.1
MKIVFWRPRLSHKGLVLDPVQHRCPLFCRSLHSSPARTLAIDAMHCLHLGVVMRHVSSCLWRVILENPWAFTGSEKMIQDAGVRQIWAELKQWQDAEGMEPKGRINGLTAKMMGKQRGYSTQDLFYFSCLQAFE